MAEARQYRPNFSDLAAEFIFSLPKRRQRKVMDRAHELARYPFIESDYSIVDEEGHRAGPRHSRQVPDPSGAGEPVEAGCN